MAFFQYQRNLINNFASGNSNLMFGEYSQYITTTGACNVGIGWGANEQLSSGSRNTAIGRSSLLYVCTGNDNTAIGVWALSNTGGVNNSTAIGAFTYYKNNSGGTTAVTAVGACAGMNGSGATNNQTLIGLCAGIGLTTGQYNVLIGARAGAGLSTGQCNTIIGINCPAAMVGCSGTLLISWGNNAGAPRGYIEGESTGISIGNTSPSAALHVTGEIVATLDITAFYSDRRLKDNIIVIDCALDKIKNLTGVKYSTNSLAKKLGFEENKTQLGLLADEVEKVLPEAVSLAPFDTDKNKKSISGENYLTVKYERIIPLLIEGMKTLDQKLNILNTKLLEIS